MLRGEQAVIATLGHSGAWERSSYWSSWSWWYVTTLCLMSSSCRLKRSDDRIAAWNSMRQLKDLCFGQTCVSCLWMCRLYHQSQPGWTLIITLSWINACHMICTECKCAGVPCAVSTSLLTVMFSYPAFFVTCKKKLTSLLCHCFGDFCSSFCDPVEFWNRFWLWFLCAVLSACRREIHWSNFMLFGQWCCVHVMLPAIPTFLSHFFYCSV